MAINMLPGKTPNAIGRHGAGMDWLPIHIDQDGQQFEPSGLLIVPFAFTERMSQDELANYSHGGLLPERLSKTVPLDMKELARPTVEQAKRTLVLQQIKEHADVIQVLLAQL